MCNYGLPKLCCMSLRTASNNILFDDQVSIDLQIIGLSWSFVCFVDIINATFGLYGSSDELLQFFTFTRCSSRCLTCVQHNWTTMDFIDTEMVLFLVNQNWLSVILVSLSSCSDKQTIVNPPQKRSSSGWILFNKHRINNQSIKMRMTMMMRTSL